MRPKWPLAFLLVLAGCGGGGQGDTSFFEGNVGSASVTFTAGTGYNGLATPLNALTALDGSATGKVVTITATANNRAVEVALIAPKATAGTVVDLTGTTGSSVVYDDPLGKYAATSGTITITARTTNSVTLTLTNVVVSSNSTSTAATAPQGSVTLNGTLTFSGS